LVSVARCLTLFLWPRCWSWCMETSSCFDGK